MKKTKARLEIVDGLLKALEDIDNIISPEFKGADHKVVILKPDYDENGLPVTESLLSVYDKVTPCPQA